MHNAEEVREHLQRGVDSLGERLEKARETNTRIHSLRSAVISQDESVRVEVDASGRLTSIDFGHSASAISPEQLSRIVMETYAEAQRRCAAKVGELVDDAWGSDSATAQTIRQEAEERVVELPEDDENPDQPRSARWGAR